MEARLTYTTGSRSAELDRAFEAALADAPERHAEPLTHLVGGQDVSAGLGPYYVQQFAREQSRTIVEL